MEESLVAAVAAVESLDGLIEQQPPPVLTLVCDDGEQIQVPKQLCVQLAVVQAMCEFDQDAKEVPVHGVKSCVLHKIIEYMRMHDGNPASEIERPLRCANDMSKCVSAEDAKFIDAMELDLVLDLVRAADRIGLKPLLQLTCAKVASLIKGKTIQEMCEVLQSKSSTLKLPKEWTPEELEQIKKEDEWTKQTDYSY